MRGRGANQEGVMSTCQKTSRPFARRPLVYHDINLLLGHFPPLFQTHLNDCGEDEHKGEEYEVVEGRRVSDLRQVRPRLQAQKGHSQDGGHACGGQRNPTSSHDASCRYNPCCT